MSQCDCGNWTLEDLSNALLDMHKGNKRIVVPMFQRGAGRWKLNQEKTFIDSLVKGYPVGTMLFYKTVENGAETYILIDGLQRGNTIKKYMTNPTMFFYDESIGVFRNDGHRFISRKLFCPIGIFFPFLLFILL